MSDETDETIATDQGGTTRRTLILGAGAVGATAALAACGTDTSDDSVANSPIQGGKSPDAGISGGASNDSAAAGSGDTGGTSGGTKIAAASEIPVGGGVIFADRGVVVTQPTAGTFKGFDAICTHKGCPVTAVEGGTINCKCHNSKFSIEDGSVRGGPASKALAPKTVTKSGADIVLS